MEKKEKLVSRLLIPLSKETIDKCFEGKTNQWEWLICLMRVLYPNWDRVAINTEFPLVNKEVHSYIGLKAIEFDQVHHPKIMAGGLWMNCGFSCSSNKSIPDWTADITRTKLLLKSPKRLYQLYKQQWYEDHADLCLEGHLFLFPLWDKNMQPACFDEWYLNEYQELKQEIEGNGEFFEYCYNCGSLVYELFDKDSMGKHDRVCKDCKKTLKLRDTCPFCGKPHNDNFVLCSKCDALICDRCDIRFPEGSDPMCPDCMEEKSYSNALKLIKKAHKGISFSISKRMAEDLIKDFNLKLEQRHYNMSGETSALFEFEGEQIRIENEWTGSYRLYHGDWESDPHWTGD
jgi:hypothetical protein